MSIRFGRVLTAMVTPFRADDTLDYEKAAQLAVALIDSGSDGVVVAGTTGESPTITMAEQAELFRVIKQAVGSRGTVIGGAGANSTSECLELCHAAQKAGCDGLLLVSPYYNKPSQEGLYRHFKKVAESVELPIILYNIPGRCSINIEPATTLRLAELPNIVAMKEASGILDQTSELTSRLGSDFQVYSGDDSLTLPIMAAGGIGVISVASHLVGRQIKTMVTDFAEGRISDAVSRHRVLYPFFKTLFITTNPVPVKAAMKLAGWDCGSVRLPLVDANENETARIKAAIEALKEGLDIKPLVLSA